jgi:hypothetical protein
MFNMERSMLRTSSLKAALDTPGIFFLGVLVSRANRMVWATVRVGRWSSSSWL